jgi:hypothetical protein
VQWTDFISVDAWTPLRSAPSSSAWCALGFIALAILLAVVAVRRERERKEGLGRWATYNGWIMTLRPAVDWGRLLPGRNRRGVTLALSGTVEGHPVTIAEYHYTETTSSTNANGSSTSSSTTYPLRPARGAIEPPRPEHQRLSTGALSKFGRSLFGDRATAIGHEPFDNEYRVAAKDASVVPYVLRPALVQEHVAGRLPGWSLEGQDLLADLPPRAHRRPGHHPGPVGPLVRVATLLES